MSSGILFTDDVCDALAGSLDLAEQCGHSQLLPIHLGIVLITSSSLFKRVVERAHGDTKLLDRAMKKALVRTPCQDRPLDRVSPACEKVLQSANDLSKTQKEPYITVDHLIQCRP
jgi:ATP-dependent Clp protease ATP-binding subunit ClpB